MSIKKISGYVAEILTIWELFRNEFTKCYNIKV